MLKWTYAYGYYAFEDADRNSEVARHKGFFEFLQVCGHIRLCCLRVRNWACRLASAVADCIVLRATPRAVTSLPVTANT